MRNNFLLQKVNWGILVQNSIAEKDPNEIKDQPVTEFNKSLLQVCIENEECLFYTDSYIDNVYKGKGKW